MTQLPSRQVWRGLLASLTLAVWALMPWPARALDLAGRVVDEAGQGMPGVHVSVAPNGPTTVTAADGRFVISGLAPGTYRLTFTAEPDLRREQEVSVADGEPPPLTILLEPPSAHVLFSATVTAVSRKEEPLLYAPAAATRLGAEEIERSSLHGQAPRLFAMIPGVEVVQNGLYDFNLNARGFNTMVSTRVLTRLDGRDPSVPINIGNPNWAELTFAMEELGAAEFVRGPSSALYGASAYNGLVDLRTTDPKDAAGGKLRITAGEKRTQRYYASHAGKLADDWHFRAFGGYHHSGTFSRSRVGTAEYDLGSAPSEAIPLPRTTEEIATLGGRLDHYFTRDTLLVVEGGATQAEGQVTVTGLGRSQATDVSRPWANVRLRGSSWQLTSFYTGQQQDNQINLTSGQPSFISAYNAGIESQARSGLAGGRVEILGGFALGRQYSDSKDPAGRQTVLGAPSQANRGAAFGQIEAAVTDSLRLFFTARGDESGLFDARFSPRAAIVYSPFSRHSLRASFNDSFQQAGLVSYFLDTPIAQPIDLSGLEAALQPLLGGIELGFGAIPVVAVGNPGLIVEKIRTVEVGYTAAPGSDWLLSLSLYKNRSKDFATNLLPQTGTSLGRLNPAFGPYQPPVGLSAAASAAVLSALDAALPPALRSALSNRSDGSPVFVPLSLTNFGLVDSQGTELEISRTISQHWLLRANFSYFDFKVQREAPENLLLPNAPKYQAKSAVLYLTERLDASVQYRWVNGFPWSSGVYQGDVPSYSVVDVNANYRLSRHWSIGGDITNCFGNQHYELFGGDLLGRRALAAVSLYW